MVPYERRAAPVQPSLPSFVKDEKFCATVLSAPPTHADLAPPSRIASTISHAEYAAVCATSEASFVAHVLSHYTTARDERRAGIAGYGAGRERPPQFLLTPYHSRASILATHPSPDPAAFSGHRTLPQPDIDINEDASDFD
jgi:hypothetical protein